MRFLGRILVSGSVASIASALAAALCSRAENRHAARPINAIAHIYDGGRPPAADGRARRNTALGFGIHTAASLWWALFFEALPRRWRNEAGAAAVSAMAYFVDYHVVHRRFRPGFERHLSPASRASIYLALAAGFAAAGRLDRRLDDHEVEDGDEGHKRRNTQRRPGRVKAPEALR